MFGDNTDQATDNVVNPAQPPANIGDPLAPPTPTDTTDPISLPTPPLPVQDNQDSQAEQDNPLTPTSSNDTLSFSENSSTPSGIPQPTDTPITDEPAITDSGVAAAAPALPTTLGTDDTDDDSVNDTGTDDDTDTSSTDVSDDDTTESSPSTPLTSDDIETLVGIKQQALEQLNPLVDQLEQSPEERFRTTMMMIQASDNQELIKQAFEVAQKIDDDKARAQALLDVINEINYFTTQAK